MSVLAIVLIGLGVVILIVLVGGFLAVRRRSRREEEGGTFERALMEADQALEQARAADKGWDRNVMVEAARKAVTEARPGSSYELHLVLVDDRPGVTEDRAQFLGMAGDDQVRVTLARRGEGWVAEAIE